MKTWKNKTEEEKMNILKETIVWLICFLIMAICMVVIETSYWSNEAGKARRQLEEMQNQKMTEETEPESDEYDVLICNGKGKVLLEKDGIYILGYYLEEEQTDGREPVQIFFDEVP